MIRITITAVRPSTNVQFFVSSTSYQNYFNTNYVMTGKVSVEAPILSGDGLTLTSSLDWRSAEDNASLRDDPIFISDYSVPSAEHNLDNGITTTRSQEDTTTRSQEDD